MQTIYMKSKSTPERTTVVQPQSYANETIEEDSFITMCCYCRRIKLDNSWHFVDIVDSGEISHGYCPTCFENFVTPMLITEIAK